MHCAEMIIATLGSGKELYISITACLTRIYDIIRGGDMIIVVCKTMGLAVLQVVLLEYQFSLTKSCTYIAIINHGFTVSAVICEASTYIADSPITIKLSTNCFRMCMFVISTI